MSNPQKDLRKQLKNIVQDILPGILASELQQNNAKELRESMNLRMEEIMKNVIEYLKTMEERQKDFQNYMIRQITPLAPEIKQEDSLTVKKEE